LRGWTRFEAAQAWLDNQANQPTQASAERAPGFPQAAKPDGVASSGTPVGLPQNDVVIYQQFLQWKKQQGR
jgi:hypothetical protein